VEDKFGQLLPGSVDAGATFDPPQTMPQVTIRNKRSLEQVQMCLGVPAPAVDDSRRFALYVLNSILGGGMSSRLFQSIREDQGLAYSIYSELSPFRDTGTLAIYAGMSPDKAERVLELTLAELRRLKEQAVTSAELKQARDQMKSNIVLGMEGASSRMSNLARQQMYFGRHIPLDEITAAINSVTTAEIQSIANELFNPDAIALSLLGNLGKLKIERAQLMC